MNGLLPPISTSVTELYDSLRAIHTEPHPTGAPSSEAHERRRSERSPSSLYAHCHEVSLMPRPPRPARVRDLSAEGIGLLVSRPFRPGALLGIELQSASGQVEARVRARVEHATYLSGDSCWLLGCRVSG